MDLSSEWESATPLSKTVSNDWESAAPINNKSDLAKAAIVVHNTDTDKYLESRKNAVDQGMPPAFASPSEGPVNLDDMNTYINYFQRTADTKTGALLSNPKDDFHNAKVAKDDTENLSTLEKTVNVLKEINKNSL